MPRKTSDVTDTQFPFDEDTVPFILVFNFAENQHDPERTGLVSEKDYLRGYAAAWTFDKKGELVKVASELKDHGLDCTLLAAWPGAQATHVFEVDDLGEATDALG